MPFRVVFFLLLCIPSIRSLAQPLDLYSRLSDPRAIARLDNKDSEPLRISSFVGWPSVRDPTDWYFLLAKDSGSGIITHIWMQLHDAIDSTTSVRIWVDDSLLITSPLYSLFRKTNGAMRTPLDSICSGALVCDVQIPYKRNFRITYYADWNVCCLYYAIEYRRLADSNLIESFRLDPSAQSLADQKNAENRFRSNASPWDDTKSTAIERAREIRTGDTLILADITGSGLIQTLHIIPNVIDSAILRKVSLEMFWDNSPYPSVNVPLPDFFGCGAGLRDVNAFSTRATKGGEFTSYFPMPFFTHGKIVLVNRSSSPVSILSTVRYVNENVDRSKYGYFSAIYNESTPAIFSVFHPVANLLGRGRYVGVHLAFPGYSGPYFLEGDPIFTVDSNHDYYIRYTGLEDYLNGGWFFDDGGFSLPFAGCPERWASAYRFHFLDAYDFKRSFNAKIEHGVRNDFIVNYRSVSFFYLEWVPFWRSRDTIRAGETWKISGTGYTPGASISCNLGKNFLFQSTADPSGAFSTSIAVPSSIQPGSYILSVNGFESPNPVVVLRDPAISIVRDSIPYLYRYKEKMTVRGNGFPEGSIVMLKIDTVTVCDNIVIGADHNFRESFEVPWLAAGTYTVIALVNKSQQILSDSTFSLTRTLNYEIENLYPPVFSSEGDFYSCYLGYYADTTFSQHASGFLRGRGIGSTIRFAFTSPVSDTFAISFYHAKGRQYANYDIYIDSLYSATIIGFYDTNYYYEIRRSPLLDGGIRYLAKGRHSLEFRCTGADTSNTEFLLNADNMILTPTTKFKPLPPDTTQSSMVTGGSRDDYALDIYPNPSEAEMVHVLFHAPDTVRSASRFLIDLYDVAGRKKMTILEGFSSSGSIHTDRNISSLANGSYFCVAKIFDSAGVRTIVRNLVVSR
jgi:hypothetical protein